MEALAISAANLETIEQNIGAVAKELSGVMSNVSTVNNQVNKMEEKVSTLNDEVKSLVKEIRETTIITNARQSIMQNNSIIEKKYGYYDKVRRMTESLLQAVENSNISATALQSLNQELILKNPNYWLSNALSALSSWLLNDKEGTDKEVNNALKKDSKKTSLFFCLIYLKLGRISTSINWLNKYLSEQNPTKLDKDFVTVLDLVASGSFGDAAKETTFNKINTWLERVNSEKYVIEKQQNIWKQYIKDHQDTDVRMDILELTCPDVEKLKNTLADTSTYYNVRYDLEKIAYSEPSNKTIEEILSNLIYEYESTEHEYQKENMKNNLIIQCNGNREEAERLFKKQEDLYNDENDILTTLSNIVIYKDSYKICAETPKIALSIIKPYIIESLNTIKENKDPITLNIGDFTTTTIDGTNIENNKKELEIYLNNRFKDDDNNLIITLIIINIIGIIGIFITLKNMLLCGLIIALLVIGNIAILYQLNKKTKIRDSEKNRLRTTTGAMLERAIAQVLDYKNILKEDNIEKEKLYNFLNSLVATNFAKSNSERNINIGE